MNGARLCYGDGLEANIRELTGMAVEVDLDDHVNRRFVAVGDDPPSEAMETRWFRRRPVEAVGGG